MKLCLKPENWKKDYRKFNKDDKKYGKDLKFSLICIKFWKYQWSVIGLKTLIILISDTN